jgi:hypothetical protein
MDIVYPMGGISITGSAARMFAGRPAFGELEVCDEYDTSYKGEFDAFNPA